MKKTTMTTSGRGNYSSVKHEIKIGIWYLTKSDEIKKVMVQGQEDLVAKDKDGYRHLIQVKETTHSYMKISDKRIKNALIKLNNMNGEDVAVLAIAGNKNITTGANSRCLINEKLTHNNNKSMIGYEEYKNQLQDIIDIDKMHFFITDFANIEDITKQQIRDIIKKISRNNMVGVDEEAILENLSLILFEKGGVLIDENSSEEVRDQWIDKSDLLDAAKLWVSNEKVMSWVKKYAGKITPNKIKEYTKKITWFIIKYNDDKNQSSFIKKELAILGDVNFESLTDNMLIGCFERVWGIEYDDEMKKITCKIFAWEVLIND